MSAGVRAQCHGLEGDVGHSAVWVFAYSHDTWPQCQHVALMAFLVELGGVRREFPPSWQVHSKTASLVIRTGWPA